MRCGILVLFLGLLSIDFSIVQVQSILDGGHANWRQYGFLVKVFARNKNADVMKSCLGTLISNNVVITSASCIMNEKTKTPLNEFAVLMFLKNRNSTHREKALLIEKTEEWALLEINELSTAKLCPNNAENNSIMRINLKPTLKTSSVLTVSPDEIINSNCYIVGFNTSEFAHKFLSTVQALKVDLKVERPRENDFYYRSEVTGNQTACFDDAGAPLICETLKHGTMLIGLFQKLGTPITNQEDPQTRMTKREHCSTAKEMYFSLLTEDTRLIDFIDTYKIGSFVKTYEDCKFIRESV